jgi:translation initiation factor IF-3
MDYGRFRYEESRKERESRRKAKAAILKEVRLSPKISDHDLGTKNNQAQRFLEDGDKVKVSVLFRGREMLHQDIGRGLLERSIARLAPVSTVEQPPRLEGRTMSIILAPRPEAIKQPAAQAESSREPGVVLEDAAPEQRDTGATA